MVAPTVFNSSWLKLPMQSGRFAFDCGGPEVAYMPVSVGTFTAASGAATVANTAVTATSSIIFTLAGPSGTVAAPFVATITPATGFTVGGGGGDNSTYNYVIIG